MSVKQQALTQPVNDQELCKVSDLIANSGICARSKDRQIALFYLPDTEQQFFAVDNWDPLGKANVLSRGIVGSIGQELVVASPLYKQHFSLTTGQCIEEEGVSIAVIPVKERNGSIVAID